MAELVPVKTADIWLGRPLPWPVYDSKGTLLLSQGAVVSSESQLARLRREGQAYLRSDAGSPPRRTAGSPAPARPNNRPVRLPVGAGDLIRVTMINGGDSYTLRLIGQYPRRSVLVSHPEDNGVVIAVHVGQQVKLEGFSGKDIFKAESRIVQVQLAPYPYLHLAFPREVETYAVRKYARGSFEADAYVHLPGESHPARLTDLSVSGCAIECSSIALENSASVLVSFDANVCDEKISMSLAAVVRSTKRHNGRTILGLEFTATPLTEKLALTVLSLRERR